ncbi:hypothetical protein LTR84_007504 [Exophiala bonariae]|uniref:Nephrocystin 3-like N-terminal domain-containing protein n=1 Tax=Exophiala bonariae TaxID=1690606 RepID=A0AAV9MYF0_9EURO|nr:hypothetical protein LTR84_007504 [Exophiala bonariae]
MLAQSERSEEPVYKNVVESTAPIFFLGTPHRGSKDLAGAAEVTRKVLAACGIDSNPKILASLGLQNSDLERCQESFSKTWGSYDFRVKTFQETLAMTGINLGLLNELLVPDYSSELGDARENAETLDANRSNLCRFTHRGDPNYAKVGGELLILYNPLIAQATILQNSSALSSHDALGKSTVIKSAFRLAKLQKTTKTLRVAGFFFHASGKQSQQTPLTLFRSLLYQLLPRFPESLQDFLMLYKEKRKGQGKKVDWQEEELKNVLETMLTKPQEGATVIFIDALNECEHGNWRELAYFFRTVTDCAYGRDVSLNVCLSSRKYPAITLHQCPEIAVEDCNTHDIELYVQQKLAVAAAGDEQGWEALQATILE